MIFSPSKDVALELAEQLARFPPVFDPFLDDRCGLLVKIDTHGLPQLPCESSGGRGHGGGPFLAPAIRSAAAVGPLLQRAGE